MTKSDLISYFGSRAAVARALGITRAAISAWPERPPLGRQFEIEVLTHGALRAERPESPTDHQSGGQPGKRAA